MGIIFVGLFVEQEIWRKDLADIVRFASVVEHCRREDG